MHIFPNSLPCFSDIVVLSQICFLVLETPEPSFDHDIVSPPAFTIHALTDLVLFEEIHVIKDKDMFINLTEGIFFLEDLQTK